MADAQLTQAAVRAHRVAVHQLAAGVAEVGVLAVGVRDAPPGATAHRALRARLPATADLPTGLALVHGVRGAMHLHRAADLPGLVLALRPDDAADLRRQQFGPFFAGLSGPVGAALDEVAGAMAEVMADGVRRSKGDLSTALSATVGRRLRPWCAGCGAHHVHDALFRLASLPAGLRLVPNGDGSADFVTAGPRGPAADPNTGGPSGPAADPNTGGPRGPAADPNTGGPSGPAADPTTGGPSGPAADPTAGEPRGPAADPAAARRELVRRFLRYAGPTSRDGLAAWLALSPAAARRWWELAEVVPVDVEGRRLFLHPDDLEAARSAPAARGVRLLPPYDPVLELGDRELLVPTAADRKRVWRAVANPGVVLADGAVVGTWRRRGGTVTVTPFGALSATHRRRLAAGAGEEVVVAES